MPRSRSKSRSATRRRSKAYRSPARRRAVRKRSRSTSRKRSRSLVPCKPYQVRRTSPPRRCIGSQRSPGISSSSPLYQRIPPVSMLKPCKPYQRRSLTPPRRCIGRKGDYVSKKEYAHAQHKVAKHVVFVLEEQVKQAHAGSEVEKHAKEALKVAEVIEKVTDVAEKVVKEEAKVAVIQTVIAVTEAKIVEEKEDLKETVAGSAEQKQLEADLAKADEQKKELVKKLATETAALAKAKEEQKQQEAELAKVKAVVDQNALRYLFFAETQSEPENNYMYGVNALHPETQYGFPVASSFWEYF
jgi:hypothetical protein